MAAFDMDDPEAIVSPGGVGFDINCGVRLLRTNLDEKDVLPVKEELAQSLFDHIPVGVGSKGVIPMTAKDLEEALEMGMDWSLREGCVSSCYFLVFVGFSVLPTKVSVRACLAALSVQPPSLGCPHPVHHHYDGARRLLFAPSYAWAEDKEHCEEYGRMLNADPSKVSARAKKRGERASVSSVRACLRASHCLALSRRSGFAAAATLRLVLTPASAGRGCRPAAAWDTGGRQPLL